MMGSHKEVWKDVDTDSYLDEERKLWEREMIRSKII